MECLLAALLLVAAAAESVPVAELELELDEVACAGDVWLTDAVTPSQARMHLDMVSYAFVSVRSSGYDASAQSRAQLYALHGREFASQNGDPPRPFSYSEYSPVALVRLKRLLKVEACPVVISAMAME